MGCPVKSSCRKLLALCVLPLLALPSSGQATDGEQTAELPCDAFVRHADGSWSPTETVKIRTGNGTVTIGPGVVLNRGMTINGMDWVKELEQRCSNLPDLPAAPRIRRY